MMVLAAMSTSTSLVIWGICAILFAICLYSIWRDWRIIRAKKKWMERDPTPDILLVSKTQAEELEHWPVLDKLKQG